jgi:hypothetical protein
MTKKRAGISILYKTISYSSYYCIVFVFFFNHSYLPRATTVNLDLYIKATLNFSYETERPTGTMEFGTEHFTCLPAICAAAAQTGVPSSG